MKFLLHCTVRRTSDWSVVKLKFGEGLDVVVKFDECESKCVVGEMV